MSGPGAELVVVDARGLRCPLPVIRLAQRAQQAGPGALIVVWATDPAAAADIPAWCRMRGHRLVDVHDDDGFAAYTVEVSTPGAAG